MRTQGGVDRVREGSVDREGDEHREGTRTQILRLV